jgi:isoleucyl-tRNA synthetase
MSKDTLQLPKTAFSMKASLPTKEPEILKNGKKIKFLKNLEKIQRKRKIYFT